MNNLIDKLVDDGANIKARLIDEQCFKLLAKHGFKNLDQARHAGYYLQIEHLPKSVTRVILTRAVDSVSMKIGINYTV